MSTPSTPTPSSPTPSAGPPTPTQGVPTSRRRSAVALIGAAIAVQAMTAPGQTIGISVFVDHLVDDLDVSRSAVSSAYFLGTLLGAATLPVTGRFIDRRGVRQAIRAFAVAFGAALIAMSGVVGIVTLAIGFTLTRAIGQGALTLAATTSIAVGFESRRGTALGIKTALSAALMSIFPLVATVLIGAMGWRFAWVAFGLVVWAVILPLTLTSALAPRVRLDGALGSEPDRVAPPAGGSDDGAANRPRSAVREPAPVITPAAAMRTWPFWSLTAAVSASALVGTGLVFHHVSLLAERGLSPAQAAANFVPHTVAGAVAALVAGRLADQFAPRVLLTVMLSILTVTPLLVQHVGAGPSVVVYGLALGGATAALRSIEATVMPRWYGLSAIGELRGFVMATSVAASAVGPLVLALSTDLLGDYRPGLYVFSAVGAVLVVATALTRPPDLARLRSA
ncbi:MAG: MFS transporter [Ilumatobacteraceae bacterium]